MGKSTNIYATQAREKSKQQRQTDKAAKRMLARQKKVYAKTSAPDTLADSAEPIKTSGLVQSAD